MDIIIPVFITEEKLLEMIWKINPNYLIVAGVMEFENGNKRNIK